MKWIGPDHRKRKIGLALGSGSAKGLSIIGILKVLEREHIPVDLIAGSSIGAVIGGLYAAGIPIEGIETVAMGTDWRLLISLIDPHMKDGLIRGEKVTGFLRNHLGETLLEDCRIPFSVVATDLRSGEAVVFDRGNMVTAIRASISVPLVFQPVRFEDLVLADGGLSSPVPVETVRRMGADTVIAVNLNHYHPGTEQDFRLRDIADRSFGILRHHLALMDTRSADIMIAPHVAAARWHRFTQADELIAEGERTATEMLPELRKLV